MNIFVIYRKHIINLIKKLNITGSLELPNNLNNINVDIPPIKFDGDITENEIRKEVVELCSKFPIYKHLNRK